MRIDTPSDLGNVVRRQRRARSMTQQQLADAVGVSRPWVVRLEKGAPRAELLLVIRTLATLGLSTTVAERPRVTDLDAVLSAAVAP